MSESVARKRAVIYVRLSNYRGEADPTTSPLRQREVCEQWCAAMDVDVVSVIQDLDETASEDGLRLKRPGLVEIREKWWGHCDLVVFMKLDRLARSVVYFSTFNTEAQKHGAA